MDFVFVLGKGSKWSNNELRFTLRAIEKNAKNYGKIVIVGEKPDWIKNVLHIPFPDVFDPKKNADANMVLKVQAAVYHPDVSEDFIYINDDELFLKPQDVRKIDWFHKGQMINFQTKTWLRGFWRLRLHRTMRVLVDKGLTSYHYDDHMPFRMNKTKFLECYSAFDFGDNIGYTINSMYGNFHKVAGKKLFNEYVRLFSPYTYEEIERRTQGRLYTSFNDDGLNPALVKWLNDKFPKPSKYEKSLSGMKDVPKVKNFGFIEPVKFKKKNGD